MTILLSGWPSTEGDSSSGGVDDVPIRLISEKEDIRIPEVDKQKGTSLAWFSPAKFDGTMTCRKTKE
jgi:hypothetical protein